MKLFRIPASPLDLLGDSNELALSVQQNIAVAELKPEEIQEFADGIVYDLVNATALCITGQTAFDGVFCLIRDFHAVPALARTHLVDSLCSSLSLLNASASALLEPSGDGDNDRNALAEHHYSALKAYVFFLHWVASQAEQEQKATAAKTAPAAAGGRGRSKGKKAAHISSIWDWDADRERLAKAFAGISQIDLWRLCSPNMPEEAFLLLWSQTALLLISTATTAKDKAAKEAAFKVLACCALQYKQLEHLVATLADMLNKDEHMSVVCAELAEYAGKHLGNNQLAVELLREVASVEPAVYEQQQQADAAGVRSVAGFIAELSDRLPHVVASNISLLVPHLGGKAYPIRSAIVTAIGHLIQKAFGPTAKGADAQGVHARLRSKQQLLHTLVERVRDQNAYTRARVLQTWMYLAEKTAIPLGHWVCVTQIAVGRLEDKAAIVRKCALQLLSKLLCFNPFGQFLPLDQLVASLNQYKNKLQEMQPAEAAGDPAEWAEGQHRTSQAAESHGSAPSAGASGGHADTADSAAAGAGARAGPTAEADGSVGSPAGSPAAEGAGPGDDLHNMQIEPAEHELESSLLEKDNGAATNSIDSNLEQTRTIVASLQTAVDFVKVVSESLAVVTQLLASSTMTDVQEAITLLIYCHKFQIHGAPEALRKMLPLMFSREQGVKDAVVDAVEELYLKAATGGAADPRQAAQNLVTLAQGSSLGELGALEEVIGQLVSRGLLKPMTLKALWFICSNAFDQLSQGGQGGAEVQEVRSSLTLISMAAMKQPSLVAERLDLLLKVGFTGPHHDALTTRQACIALTQLSAMSDPPTHQALQPVYKSLTWVLLSGSLPDSTWYTAVEATVTAIYALHPAPQELAQVIVQRLGKLALQGGDTSQAESGEAMDTDDMPQSSAAGHAPTSSAVSASRLSRLFFTLGQVAIQHLLYVERLAKAVRKKRADAEKTAAEAQHAAAASNHLSTSGSSRDDEEDADIAAQLGVGSLAADVELDALKDAAEGEILGMHNLLARYAPLLAALCHNRALLASHVHLRSSSLLALTKLMAIDPAFCDANLALVFTLLEKRSVEPSVRSNLVIALGDLAFRFPNLLEPWTERIYGPLSDPDTGVRKNSLMVLTHLIMNDMMKVKGHIARMALCLQDPHPRIKDLAHLFFHELSQKNYKGTSPIYNLLPDMLSSLSSEADLLREHFQAIMRHLLTFIAKEKHIDSLVEKLCLRFAATQDRKQWRNIAFCLGQLSIGEKGFRKMADMLRCYKDSLADPDILAFFQGCIAKAKKLPKLSSETKADIEAFEGKLAATAAEKQEEQATAEAARKQAAGPEDMDTSDDGAGSQSEPEEYGAQAGESSWAAEPGPKASKASASAAAGAQPCEAGPAASQAAASSSQLADSSGSGSAKGGLNADASAAASSQRQEAGTTASAGADASTNVDKSHFDEVESSVSGVERQLQQLALQKPGVESGGADMKENRQQAGNAVPAPGGHERHSGPSRNIQEDKRISAKAAASKTRRSARLSETHTSPSSAEQDSRQRAAPPSPDQSVAQDPTADVQVPLSQASSAAQPASGMDLHARESIAESAVIQASALAETVRHALPAVTPVKAPQAAKSSGDLDKLLGSRLKSVRPSAVVRQSQEADSPVAALRGHLRRVKLEEGVEASSPLLSSPQDRPRSNVTGASPSQVAPAVQLRRVKQEPEDELQMSQQHAAGQAQKGVSALKGFWETQSVAKPGRH